MKTLIQHLNAVAGPTGTHRAATIAFVGLAALDAFNPGQSVTNSWWLILLLVWLMPWPHVARTGLGAAQQRWIPVVSGLLALVVLSWLYLRVDTALRDVLSYWLPFQTLPPGPRALSYPLQDVIVALAAGLLIGMPLHRIAGKYAVAAALLVVTPWLLTYNLGSFFDTTLWDKHPGLQRSRLFEVVISVLLLAEVCSVLVRRNSRLPQSSVMSPTQGSLASLGRRVTSGVVARSGLLAATVATFVWFLTMPTESHLAYQLHLILAPLWAIALTAAFVSLLRAVRQRASHAVKPGYSPTRAFQWFLSLLLLAPIWAWATLHAAPLAGASMTGVLKSGMGTSWNFVCNETDRTIIVDAELHAGFTELFRKTLDSCPDTKTVILSSGGGSGTEARHFGQLIRERQLATRVRDFCASACAYAFAGGNPRILDEGASLGFHSGRYYSTWHQWLYPPGDIGILPLEQGISADFLTRAAAVPHEELWTPSNEELLEAGYVTEIRTKGRKN